MSKKTLYIIAIFTTISIGALLHMKYCCTFCNSTLKEFNNPVDDKQQNSNISIKNKIVKINDTALETTNPKAEVLTKVKSDIEWQALKTSANTNPLTLYFNKNESNINLSKKDSLKVIKLINYTANFPKSILLITGHADNSGEEISIQYYAKERATLAKKYFISKGINSEQIIISSKGSNNPIADNTTAEGRAKNRRVEVTIQ